MTLNILLLISGSYLLGAMPVAFLLGKAKGVDLRKHGSGNLGATNVNRVLGKRWGVLCFALDFSKGLLPALVARLWVQHANVEAPEVVPVLAAAAAVVGHIWPVYLGFRGGKGVATTLGAVLALAPLAVAAAMFSWYLVFLLSRYVSLASIVAAAVLPLAALLGQSSTPTRLLLVVLAALIILRHRSNISRLLQGTESRFERKKCVVVK